MRSWIALLTLLVTAPVFAAPADLVGRWEMAMELPGTKRENRFIVEADGDAFKARWGGLQYEGAPSNDGVQFRCLLGSPDTTCGRITLRARGVKLEGEGDLFGAKAKITGQRPAPRRAEGPRTFSYEPERFPLHFSGAVDPVLRIFPGDTVRTWTLDAAGGDSKGVARSFPGNPQTGPFFIEGAMPGDTLAVRFNRRSHDGDRQLHALRHRRSDRRQDERRGPARQKRAFAAASALRRSRVRRATPRATPAFES